MNIESVKPTVIIGAGGAGREIADNIRKVIEGQLTDAQAALFKYVLVDTKNPKPLGPDREIGYPVQLERPSATQFHEQHVNEFHYLQHDGSGIAFDDSQTGAERDRRLGRYQFAEPSNRQQVYSRIKTALNDLSDEAIEADSTVVSEQSNFNVWVVSSLSGGTGSGIFPYLAVLLDEINAPDLYVQGIGAVPTDLEVEGNETFTGGRIGGATDTDEYINTYTALREIEAMTDTRRMDDLVFRQENSGEEIGFTDGRPFKNYYLLGYKPEEDDKTPCNRTAGLLTLWYALLDSPENFPDTGSIDDSQSLWAVTGSEIHVPTAPRNRLSTVDYRDAFGKEYNTLRTQELSAAVENKRKQQELKSSQETDYKKAKRFIDELLTPTFNDNKFDSDLSIFDEEDSVPDALPRTASNEAANIEVYDLLPSDDPDEDTFDFERYVNNIVAENEDFVDDQVDPERVARYLLGGYLYNHIRNNLEPRHEFYEKVEGLVNRMEKSESSDLEPMDAPFNRYDGPIDAYNKEIRQRVDELYERAETKAAEQSAIKAKLPGVTNWHEKKRSRKELQDNLTRAKSQFDMIRGEKNTAKRKYQNAKGHLENTKSELAELEADRRSIIEDLRDEISKKRHAMEVKTDRIIEETQTAEGFTRIHLNVESRDNGTGVTNESDEEYDERISSVIEIANNYRDLLELLETEYLKIEHVVETLGNELDNLDDIEELVRDGNSKLSIGTVSATELKKGEQEDSILDQAHIGERTLADVMTDRGYHGDKIRVSSANPSVVWLLGLHTGLDLDSMYEYSHLNGHFEDPDRVVSDTPLGQAYGRETEAMTDAGLARRFAYPEVLKKEDREYILRLAESDKPSIIQNE